MTPSTNCGYYYENNRYTRRKYRYMRTAVRDPMCACARACIRSGQADSCAGARTPPRGARRRIAAAPCLCTRRRGDAASASSLCSSLGDLCRVKSQAHGARLFTQHCTWCCSSLQRTQCHLQLNVHRLLLHPASMSTATVYLAAGLTNAAPLARRLFQRSIFTTVAVVATMM